MAKHPPVTADDVVVTKLSSPRIFLVRMVVFLVLCALVCVIHAEVCLVENDVHVAQFTELAKLQRGEPHLQRPAPTVTAYAPLAGEPDVRPLRVWLPIQGWTLRPVLMAPGMRCWDSRWRAGRVIARSIIRTARGTLISRPVIRSLWRRCGG